MENKIKEVQQYFKNKLLAGDFKITERTEHTIVLEIDEKYLFSFWAANGVEWLELYREFNHFSFIDIEFTPEEKDVIWEKLHSERHKEPVEEKRKRLLEQKERIEKQIEDLGNGNV